MQYLHTMIRISNIEESIHFFCDILGMKEVKRTEHEQGRFTLIFLAAAKDQETAKQQQSPLLELTYNWPNEDNQPTEYNNGNNFGHLAYRVDNIYEFCQKLIDSGVTINRPPRDGRMAFIRSPDGISIELLQAGDALTPIKPWTTMPNIGKW